MTAEEALGALLATLEQLREILPDNKADWDRQRVVQLAAERLWITAGNLAEFVRVERAIAAGVEPWAELAGYRNLLAHALPGDISSDRVFADSSTDLARLVGQVRSHLI